MQKDRRQSPEDRARFRFIFAVAFDAETASLTQIGQFAAINLLGTSKNTPGQTRANQIRFYSGEI
jgi:hypothetical protein